MYTSSINSKEALGAHYLETHFKEHLIPRRGQNLHIGTHDALIKISKGKVTLEETGEKLSNALIHHRVSSTINLFQYVLNNKKNPIDCEIVICPEDHIYAGENPKNKFTKIGYSANPDSPYIPVVDPHLLSYIGGPTNDPVPFKNKSDVANFRGSSTSQQRVRIAESSLGKNLIDAKICGPISDWCELERESNRTAITCEWTPISSQLQNKYILDIYGHTITWDRPAWALGSNSILIKINPDISHVVEAHTWYSHFTKHYDIIPWLSEDTLLSLDCFAEFDSYNERQKDFSQTLLSHSTIEYITELFLTTYNSLYNL